MFCFKNQKAYFLLVLLKKKKKSGLVHTSIKPSCDSERPLRKLKWLSLQPPGKKKEKKKSIQYLRQDFAKVSESAAFSFKYHQ